MTVPSSIREVVESGLCIGCGLCEAVADDLKMVLNDEGVERPVGVVTSDEEQRILSACPGARISGNVEPDTQTDEVWGALKKLVMGWSGEPQVRFEASTGGVLTALGRMALKSGLAKFVLHAGTNPDNPLLSTWVMSDTPEDVLANSGSRYGPASVLAGLKPALARKEPFVLIAKPCDISAMRNYMKVDEQARKYCVALLTMVCGGQSAQGKTTEAVEGLGIKQEDVADFRYRGFGNPGPHRITLKDGSYRDIDYNAMWGSDDSDWRIQSRCKVCADPIGQAADVAASDTWPGGGPEDGGDDEGFNGILVRTSVGGHLMQEAVAAGMMELGKEISCKDFDLWQPHNVRKLAAVRSRFDGMSIAGKPVPVLEELADASARMTYKQLDSEREGTSRRVREGKFAETSRIIRTD